MRWFSIKRTIKFGLKSLWMHRMRSTLTTLGIVFGVCSVIAMLAIGEGASKEAQEAIIKLGSMNLIIETVEPPKEEADSSKVETIRNFGLTYADAESIRNTIPNIEVTVPIREINQEARYLKRKVAIKIIGTVPWYKQISSINIIRGRFLSSIDLHYQQNICVIDENIAKSLFAFEHPIGKDIKIRDSYYQVVGIAEAIGTTNAHSGFANTDTSLTNNASGGIGNVYIPMTTAKTRFSELELSISGGSRSGKRVKLQKITVKVSSMEEVLPMVGTLETLLNRLHEGKQDYRIVVPLELLRQAAQTRRIFSIVLASIAGISLMVGGIGIMNIMLASVSERTREIGIRRALGAKKRDIVIQFLTETVMLTLLGGLLGISIGSIIPSLVTYFAHMATIVTGWSLILSFGVSGAVGVIFGLYPACRAANMDPIESLRHE